MTRDALGYLGDEREGERGEEGEGERVLLMQGSLSGREGMRQRRRSGGRSGEGVGRYFVLLGRKGVTYEAEMASAVRDDRK